MSFRSLSGLPSCLRGRQALRCPRKYSLAPYTSHKPATSPRHSSNPILFVPSVERSDSSDTRWSPLNESRVCSTDPKFDTEIDKKATAKSIHSDVSQNETPFSQPNSRVGQGLGIPDSIQEPNLWQDTESECGRLNYIALNDKFLAVMKDAPDQVTTVFGKETLFANQFIGEFTHDADSLNEFRRKWQGLSLTEQDKLLPGLIFGSLARSASQTLFVLEGIRTTARNFRIRMNCLRSVSIMYLVDLQTDPSLKRLYEAQIDKLRSPTSWPRDKMPMVLLRNLLYWSNPDQCEVIIEDFFRVYPGADGYAMVAVIDHYLRLQDGEKAFDYFRRLPDELLRDPNDTIKTLRDRLLKLDVVVRTDNGSNFKYLPQILALGMPSDEALHNIVLENAISNGLPDVAWDVYQYLETSEFQVDARSHLVLLRDAFTRGTLPKVNAIMTAIHRRKDLASDPYLVAYSMNIVRVLCCYERQINATEALAHIMALYDRAYDRAPLVKLRIIQERTSSESLPQPTPIQLAFTVWSYILIQSSEREVVRLWQWIKHLISTGDEAITETARFDLIYNGFLLFYAGKGFNLSRSLEVVEYMLCNNLCLPTLRSWSILLCSFLRRGQAEEARRILAMMKRHGFTAQEIMGKYAEHLPAGADLERLAEMTLETLDERQLSETIEELLSSPSQQRQG